MASTLRIINRDAVSMNNGYWSASLHNEHIIFSIWVARNKGYLYTFSSVLMICIKSLLHLMKMIFFLSYMVKDASIFLEPHMTFEVPARSRDPALVSRDCRAPSNKER